MTMPAIFLGFIISTIYGAGFHLLRGGGAAHLLFYLVLAWVGFWGGNFLGIYMEWSLIPLGPLHLGLATISSGLFLLFGRWLSRVEPQEENKR